MSHLIENISWNLELQYRTEWPYGGSLTRPRSVFSRKTLRTVSDVVEQASGANPREFGNTKHIRIRNGVSERRELSSRSTLYGGSSTALDTHSDEGSCHSLRQRLSRLHSTTKGNRFDVDAVFLECLASAREESSLSDGR